MSLKSHDRKYDIVLLGATGYTGVLTAEHIAKHLPTDLKWAVAGRSEAKLQHVIDECQKLNPDRVAPSIEIASIDNQSELNALAKTTYILLTCVGPYVKYGEPAVKACAENGTHYIDVSGEFYWVQSMIRKYDSVAQASGAFLFPQSGVESAPPDLTTYELARKLREEVGAKTGEVIMNLHTLQASPSGGTISSFLDVFDHTTLSQLQSAATPYAVSPIPHTSHPIRPPRPLSRVHFDPHLGMMSTCPTGDIDASVVERTWGLLSQLKGPRSQDFYGDNFRWLQLSATNSWFAGVVKNVAIVVGSALLFFCPPLRMILRKMLTQPGLGPSREAMAKERIEFRGVARPDGAEFKGKAAYGRVLWKGGMYDLTAMFMSQAALTLLQDDKNGELGLTGGFYTPACLGQGFIERCHERDFKIETRIVED